MCVNVGHAERHSRYPSYSLVVGSREGEQSIVQGPIVAESARTRQPVEERARVTGKEVKRSSEKKKKGLRGGKKKEIICKKSKEKSVTSRAQKWAGYGQRGVMIKVSFFVKEDG